MKFSFEFDISEEMEDAIINMAGDLIKNSKEIFYIKKQEISSFIREYVVSCKHVCLEFDTEEKTVKLLKAKESFKQSEN